MATVFGLIVMFAAWFNGRRTILHLGGKLDGLSKELGEMRKEVGEMRSEFRDMRSEFRDMRTETGDLLTKILHAIEARGI
jgi:predicted nuclease with TOPRIM domain